MVAKTISDVIFKDIDLSGIPPICRYNHLSIDDPSKLINESVSWLTNLKDTSKFPIWSRLLNYNCVGHQRQIKISKENAYDVEIPKRLISLWGQMDYDTLMTEKYSGWERYQIVCNVLVCCAVLKKNMDEWSTSELDEITRRGVEIFSELCQDLIMVYNELKLEHLNNSFQWEDKLYVIQIQEKAKGFLYIPYGSNEFNLARALSWFFSYYQFGILQCQQRYLAFGLAVGQEHGYFMYDCQSKGFPIFEKQHCNSYVLRTKYLQILLYCLIVTLNVSSEKVKFKIYNVDIRITDPREVKATRKLIENVKKEEVITKFGELSINAADDLMERSSGGQEITPGLDIPKSITNNGKSSACFGRNSKFRSKVTLFFKKATAKLSERKPRDTDAKNQEKLSEQSDAKQKQSSENTNSSKIYCNSVSSPKGLKRNIAKGEKFKNSDSNEALKPTKNTDTKHKYRKPKTTVDIRDKVQPKALSASAARKLPKSVIKIPQTNSLNNDNIKVIYMRQKIKKTIAKNSLNRSNANAENNSQENPKAIKKPIGPLRRPKLTTVAKDPAKPISSNKINSKKLLQIKIPKDAGNILVLPRNVATQRNKQPSVLPIDNKCSFRYKNHTNLVNLVDDTKPNLYGLEIYLVNKYIQKNNNIASNKSQIQK